MEQPTKKFTQKVRGQKREYYYMTTVDSLDELEQFRFENFCAYLSGGKPLHIRKPITLPCKWKKSGKGCEFELRALPPELEDNGTIHVYGHSQHNHPVDSPEMDQNLRKFNPQLTKLENGNIEFKYEIEAAHPCWLQIGVQQRDEDYANCVNILQTTSLGTFWSSNETFAIPGKIYTFNIIMWDSVSGLIHNWQKCVAIHPPGYQYMPKELLNALMIRASNFYHGKVAFATIDDATPNVLDPQRAVAVNFLQRTKFDSDWDEVAQKGAIEPSIRRGTEGHATMINYCFPGSYFFAIQRPIGRSPFGDKRIMFPPNLVLGENPEENFSFYFGDFKCYGYGNGNGNNVNMPDCWYPQQGHWRMHYLTIAICIKNSDEDRYCQENLKDVQLQPMSNPFFMLNRGLDGNWKLNVYGEHNRVWIEFFMMERLSLDISNLERVSVPYLISTKVVNNNCPLCGMESLRLSRNVQANNDAIIMGQQQVQMPQANNPHWNG